MTAAQKHAWFNLTVIGATILLVLALYPLLGRGAWGGLGILGSLGFGPYFFRKKGSRVVTDERDVLIQRRSVLLGYSLFWAVFVLAACLLSTWIYGQEGSVPVPVVQVSVFFAVMLFIGVTSVATLVLYARG